MTEWYPCKWCEGEGGWHAHVEPSYSDPGETIAKLRAELEQARSQAFEEAIEVMFGFVQYRNSEHGISYNPNADVFDLVRAIRQHSQKGKETSWQATEAGSGNRPKYGEEEKAF